MITFEPGNCNLENSILCYLKTKLQHKPSFKPCVILSGDMFSNGIPLEGFQFAINISVHRNSEIVRLSFFDFKFTTAAYQMQHDGIAQLHILRVISFFNDTHFKLKSACNEAFTLETKSTFEVYSFIVELLTFISNNQYSSMSLHKELFIGNYCELENLQRHTEIQSIINEVNLFNSDVTDSRVLFFCKTNSRFKNLEAKFGVYNIDKQSVFLSLILNSTEPELEYIEHELQRQGFNANISVCTPFIGEILIFLEPQIGYDLEILLNNIVRTIF
jgi:hypothetical protein